MTDYMKWQNFIKSHCLWDEFKRKTLENYKKCDITMYKYFLMIDGDDLGEIDSMGQEDLMLSAFNVVPTGLWNDNNPDKVWEDLHQSWITYLLSINYKFKEDIC